jgi:acylphosphatase
MLSRVHVVISGRVQGVAFRFYIQRWAAELGLTGWVRNLYDGRVEVLAEGKKDDLDELLTRLREGPRQAVVENLDVVWEEPTGEFPDFRVAFRGF